MWDRSDTLLVRAWATAMIARARARSADERGDIAQTVIIIGILAAAAITIATIIATKFTEEANQIPTG